MALRSTILFGCGVAGIHCFLSSSRSCPLIPPPPFSPAVPPNPLLALALSTAAILASSHKIAAAIPAVATQSTPEAATQSTPKAATTRQAKRPFWTSLSNCDVLEMGSAG